MRLIHELQRLREELQPHMVMLVEGGGKHAAQADRIQTSDETVGQRVQYMEEEFLCTPPPLGGYREGRG